MNKQVHRVLSIILAVLIIVNSFQFTMGSKVQAAGVDTFDSVTGTLTLNSSFVAGGLKARIDAVITPLSKTYADIKVLIVTAGIVGVGKIADGGSDIATGGIIQSLSGLIDFQLIGTSTVQSSSTAPSDNIIAKNFFVPAQNPLLKSVTFLNATTINAQAFQNMSSLTTLTIPKIATISSTNAFSGCTGLSSITFGTTTPTLTSGTITTIYNALAPGATFYVPAASLAAYQSTWSAISTHISAISTGGGTGGGDAGTFDANTGTMTLTGTFAVSTLKAQIDAVMPTGKTYTDIKVLKITSGIVGADDTSNIIPLLTNLQDFQLTGTANTQSTASSSDVGIVQSNFFTAANSQLISVTLQNATTINAQAFQNMSSISTLVVPSLTTVVDASAFVGMTHLASITLGATIPTGGPTVFPASTIFFVPTGSVAGYKAAWSSVASRIKAIGETLDYIQGFNTTTGTLTLTGAFGVNTLMAEIDAIMSPLAKAYTDIKVLIITNGIVGPTDATSTIPLLTNLQDLQIVGNATTQSSSNSSTKNITPKNLASGTANTKLTSITLNNVTTLGTTTFSALDSLTNLTIPAVGTVSDAKVFQNVTNLTSITLGTTPPSSGVGFFPVNTTFFVPADKVATYKADPVWGIIDNPIKAIGQALDYTQGFDATTGTLTLTRIFAVNTLKAEIDAIINPLNKTYADIKALRITAGIVGATDAGSTGIIAQLTNLEDVQLIGSATTQSSSNSATVGTTPKNLVSSANAKLKSVTLSNVTTIGTSTFSGSGSLTALVIPSVTTVANADAFTDCTNLTSITFGAALPPAAAGPILFPANAIFYVPADKVAIYKADDVWSSVALRIKAIGDTSGDGAGSTDDITLSLKPAHPNIVSVNESVRSIQVIEKTSLEQLDAQTTNGAGTILRILDAKGIPKSEITELVADDKFVVISGEIKKEYTIQVIHYTLENLALNPNANNIKVSSFRSGNDPTNAFNGASTGNAGSGYQVDGSQSTAANISVGKNTFWLALDLGQMKKIDQFSVAWGTTVGDLTTRLKNSTYYVEYTNDPAKWASLSNATVAGSSGIATGYSKPSGWDVAYAQDVTQLPDANGNKVFMSNLASPINARYVMVTGELASNWIEIYNFYVFQKEVTNVVPTQPAYATGDLARIMPDYEGMSLTIGRPAIVKKDTAVPKFDITATTDITVTGVLKDPTGTVVYTLPSQNIASGATSVITPNVTASKLGTYIFEYTIAGSKTIYDKVYFTAVDDDITKYSYTKPYPALSVSAGKLVYVPDYRGNTVMDYSNVGYKGGGVEIPNIPVKIILEPSGDNNSDDTERIQNAINMLGRIDPDSNGFRGSILLKAGTYRVSSSIRIATSGIVIKGEGDDHEGIETHNTPLSPTNWKDYTHSEAPQPNVTKVVATWIASSYDKNTAIFNFAGAATSTSGSAIKVVDQYVPAGGHKIRLESVSGLNVGDTVNVRKAVNAAWAQDLRMDAITDAPGIPSANQWAVNGVVDSGYVTTDEERTIQSINPLTNEITLVEPLADALDMKYGVSTVTKYNPTGRISNVGIENMLIMSRFDSSTTAINTAFGVDYQSFDDELHAELAIRFGNAQNAWARTITTYHIDSAVAIATGVSKITIQDVNCLEPVSGTGGERRYNFSNAGGTLVLNQRNYSRYTRHGFIVMGNVVGQNVFYNDRTDYQFDANEPHLRWSTGGLYDNINGRIYLQDRWNNGTAHGWSGANYTLYNNTGSYIISQNQLAANYLFGQSGDRLPFVMDAVDPGNVPNFRAYEYSNGSRMTPASLFIQQLKDRMGQGAVDTTNSSVIPAYMDQSGDFASQFAVLTGIFVDGAPIANFNNEVLSYTVPVPLDYTALPVITYTAGIGVTVTPSVGGNNAVVLTATMPGKKDSVYTVNYGIINKSVPVTSSVGGSNVNNLIDGLLSTSWSASGTPWVQFYLGDKPTFISSVSLGYSRDTQIRRSYYFEFQVSNDGYTWTKVMASNWQQDNLGNGHIMGKEVAPGSDGDSASDYETFTFPADISGRLLRVAMFGARAGSGTGTSNSNKYWAIDVGAVVSGGPLTVSKQPQNVAKRAGFTASYTVTMSGGTRPYSYQWQMSKDAGATWNNVTTGTGANTATYTTGAITADMDGTQYRSKVTDADTSSPQTAYSNVAMLTVKQDTGIIVTPVDTSVSVFDNVIYSRTATIRNTSFVYGLLGYLDIKPVGSTVFIIPSNISPKTESAAAFTDAMATFWPPDDDSQRDSKKSYIRKSGEQIRDGDHLLIINPSGTGVERYIINYAKMDDTTVVSADKSVLTFDKIKGQNTAPDAIIGNLNLPTTSNYGSTISWKVDNNTNLSATGVVKRPLFVAGDASVTLTATLTSGTVIDTVVFNLIILKKNAEELPSNLATVTAKGSTETGYLWGLAVDNSLKTIIGLAASTSVDVFKNGLILAPSASWKVVTSAVASTVTAATFASAIETTKNVANGNVLIVLAEDGATLNKYPITLKPTAATPSAVAVPGKKFNTTKLTGLVAGTTYEYVIRTTVGMPSGSTWASSSVQFTTGAGETERDNLFVTQGSYLYIRAAETATMSASSPMYILIDISQINKTVDASAPTVTLQPGSNHLTTKLTGLLPGTAYEYIVNTSAQELVNWDAALLFTTASSDTTKDNIPVLTGQYLHIRFSATDIKEASSEKNIYVTADLVKVKPANATPQSSALPGTLGGTTKLTGLLPNTTYLYIINTNTDNPATDAWDHKGQSITTGNGQTVYDNIVSSPELYMHVMAVENSSNANSLPQNYLVGAGGVKSLPQGVIPTASAEPGTVGGTMKLTGLLPETAYEFVVTDALSSPKNTTWGEGIVIRTKTSVGETTIDNIEVPADLGNIHVRTGGTTTNSPSEAQNFIILGSYVNNAAGALSNNAYVTAATSGPGYIPGIIVSGKAPNFTIRNVPAGTTKEALKATLLKNSKAGWKVVANASVSATVKDAASFNSAREISTNVSIDNVLTVLAEDGKTVQRYTITNNVTTISLTGITVKTPPTKASYTVGDALDLTGLEIEAAYSDSTKANVIGYMVTPASGTPLNTPGITMVTISYTEDSVTKTTNFTVSVNSVTVTLTGIIVKTPPTKTSYTVGDALDFTGLEIEAAYSDSTKAKVSSYTVTPVNGTLLNTTGTSTITVSYTENGVTKTTNFVVSAHVAAVTLTGIAVKPQPTKTSYTVGDALDFTGMEIEAAYSDSTKANVSGYTVTPANGTLLHTSGTTMVAVSYTEGSVTKTTNFVVIVNAASSNAKLSGISLSTGALNETFTTVKTSYTQNVANTVVSLTLIPTAEDAPASVKVNGTTVISGQPSEKIALNVGENIITVDVTAADGSPKTYTVTVTRASAPLTQPSNGDGGGGDTSDTVMSTNGNLTLPKGKIGEVSLGDVVKISIPADASGKELKLSIEKVLDTQGLLTEKEVLASPIYEILKNFSENFSKTVTLSFAFDLASLKSNQKAAVFYYDEVKKEWVEVAGSKVNGNHITVEVNHFTKYAVFAIDHVVEKPTTENPTDTIPHIQFSDITGHWAEVSIKQAVSKGIVSGYLNSTFKPNATVTRAEFAVMLMNTMKPQGEGAALTFTDTAKIGSWALKAVAQAVQAGIIQGYEDGSFRPDAEITRAEMAVMLANAMGLAVDVETATGFTDDKDVPVWSKGAVTVMKKQGLIEGKGNNEFGPTARTTRAEAVTVLLRMLA